MKRGNVGSWKEMNEYNKTSVAGIYDVYLVS